MADRVPKINLKAAKSIIHRDHTYRSGSPAMPTYEYHCKKCGQHFEQTMTLRQHEQRKQKPACPHCKSHAVEQVPASFQAVTSSKS